jgi:hypothetical protein
MDILDMLESWCVAQLPNGRQNSLPRIIQIIKEQEWSLEELLKLTPTDSQLFKLPWGPLQLVIGQIRPFKHVIKSQLAKDQGDKEEEDKDEDSEDEDGNDNSEDTIEVEEMLE